MDFSVHSVNSVGLRTLLGGVSDLFSGIASKGTLVFISQDEGGSDFIRVVSPIMFNPSLRATKICLRDIEILGNGACNRLSPMALKHGHITFLVSRTKIDSTSLSALIEAKQRYKCRLVVDMDDDLFGISKSHPQFKAYQAELEKLRTLLNAADLLVASTEEVAHGVDNEGIKVPKIVIPNYLDDRIWPLVGRRPSYKEGPIKVLYSGTETHDNDLRLLEPVIPQIADRIKRISNREIEFHVVGGTTIEIPGLMVHKVPDEVRRYDKFVPWLLQSGEYHLAVAPLCLDDRLNHAKSNLKFLEYSAMSLPCVYTSIEPYAKTICDGVDGFLIDENDEQKWVDRICDLAMNDALRESMGVAAYTKLIDRYLLSNHFEEWSQLFGGKLSL